VPSVARYEISDVLWIYTRPLLYELENRVRGILCYGIVHRYTTYKATSPLLFSSSYGGRQVHHLNMTTQFSAVEHIRLVFSAGVEREETD